jgi:hypothetical protein
LAALVVAVPGRALVRCTNPASMIIGGDGGNTGAVGATSIATAGCVREPYLAVTQPTVARPGPFGAQICMQLTVARGAVKLHRQYLQHGDRMPLSQRIIPRI